MSDLGSNIDKLFKDGLGETKINPPNSVFNSVKGQINNPVPNSVATGSKVAAKTFGFTSIKVAVVATVAASAITGLYWLNANNTEKAEPKKVVQQKIEEDQHSNELNAREIEDTIVRNNAIQGVTENQSANNDNTYIDRQTNDAHAELWVIVEEDEAMEADVVEESPRDFEKNPNSNSKVISDQNISSDCKLVRSEIDIQDNILNLNLTNISSDIIPIEINWGDFEPIRVVLENKIALKHKYYVLNSKEFKIDIRAIGKNCVQNNDRSLLIKNNLLPQEIIVPNIFTPNSDGLNDSFYVEMPQPKEFNLRVISPMKQIVFETENWKDKWSGDFKDRPCEKGIYTVILKYKYSGDADWKSKTSTVWLNRN